jgi:hypothetical protein
MVSLKNLESYVKSQPQEDIEGDILSDVRYICSSCALITEALQKGCDILQMPNGDIIVTELKPVTFQYTWDEKKGKLVRVQAGVRTKRTRKNASSKSKTSKTEVIEEREFAEAI